MPYCEYCGEQIEYLPFRCKYCGGTYCKKHRLPENHECSFELKISPVVPDTSRDTKPLYTDVKIRRAYRDTDYKRQKEIKKYLKEQRKAQRSARRSPGGFFGGGFGSQKTEGTTYLIILIVIFSIVAFFLPTFLAFSLFGLTQYFFWIFLTAPFVSYTADLFGLFFLFILIIFLYNIAKNIELRFGTKFLISLYLFCTGITALFYILIRSLLAITYPVTFGNAIYVGLATGGILGLISFIIYFNPDREMMLFCYFIPVRMKGKLLLVILVLFRLLPGLLFGLLISPAYFAIYIPDLGGLLGAYLIFYKNYKYR